MRMKKNNNLTAREERFCALYAQSGEGVLAAKAAGYPAGTSTVAAAQLLGRDDILEAVGERLRAVRLQAANQALAGLVRLAFGNPAGGVRLLREGDELSGEELDGLDLFSVSEVRRSKDGAYEVRFYDRMKALELLLTCGEQGADGAGDLLDALSRGAEALGRGDSGV